MTVDSFNKDLMFQALCLGHKDRAPTLREPTVIKNTRKQQIITCIVAHAVTEGDCSLRRLHLKKVIPGPDFTAGAEIREGINGVQIRQWK